VGRGPGGRRWLAPAAIVLLALVLRVGAVVADTGYAPGNDALEYDYLARSIAAGDGYPQSGYLLQGGPTAIRGPGYPYLLGAVYALSGDSLTAGRFTSAALGALSVLLLYLIAKRLWGRRIGLLAAALAAVFPPLVLVSRDLVSESLFISLELGALLCVLNFRRSGGALRWAAAAGALCGLAALTRNTGIALLLPLMLGVWTLRRRPGSLAAPAILLGCSLLVVVPWLLRDESEFGRFVPITTSSGFAAAGTYNADSFHDFDSHGAWRNPQTIRHYTPLFTTPGIDEGEVDLKLRHAARDFAWEHPGYVAETTGWNLLRLFEIAGGSVVDDEGHVVNDRGIGSADPTVERIGIAIAGAFALLGAFAIFRSRSQSRSRDLPPLVPSGPPFLWLVPILMILVAAPIAGLPRYRLPADPFLLILAAIGVAWLWDQITAAGSARTA
jgi:4-amino-4-deoxy-L-arabinose transferase-like glycosyltransferase